MSIRRRARRATRIAGYTVGTLLFAFLVVQGWFFAHVVWYRGHNPASTAFMHERLETLRETRPRARLIHEWVPYRRISVYLRRAVIASEDAKFVEHDGFDWEAIQEAAERNLRRGRTVAGGSTISQQLAKNLFLSGARSWLRKGEEAIITWMIESTMSKRRILELYLNVAEWGENIYGAQAAALHHFGVPASALNPEQAAWLAAVLPSPRRYEYGRTTPYLAARIGVILARMPDAELP